MSVPWRRPPHRKMAYHWYGNGTSCRCGPGGHKPGAHGSQKLKRKVARVLGIPTDTQKRNKHPKWMRDIRAGMFPCHYCGESGARTIDHKIPRSKGGLTNQENCVPACLPCNNWRGSRYTYEEFKAWGWKQRPFSGSPRVARTVCRNGRKSHWWGIVIGPRGGLKGKRCKRCGFVRSVR